MCELELCGFGLADVPPELGWDLELLILEQTGVKSAAGPSEVQTKIVDVVDVDDDSSLSEGDSDDVHITRCEVMLAETRSEPVLDFSEQQPELGPGLEERLDDFAEKVADIDVNWVRGLRPLLKIFKQHRCKHPPRRLFLRGRFLPGRSPNKALLRMNLKTPAEDEPEDPSSKKVAPTTSKLA